MDADSEQYPISGKTAADLVASVEDAVGRGELSPGAALPSVRALAARLGVAPGTVSASYAALRARGVVVTAPRSGTRVAAAPTEAVGPDVRVPEGTVDLRSGNPDPALLPDPRPQLARLDVPLRLYGAPPVLPALADAARSRLAGDGVHVASDSLLVTSGALEAVGLTLGTVLRPGDAVAVEDPGWVRLLELCRARGWQPVPVEVDDAGPSPTSLQRALEAGARAAVVTSRGQNPTGAAVSLERAERLGRLLAEHPGVLLVEDDHAAEVAGVPLAVVPGPDGRGHPPRWAHVRATAKTLGPDLRLAVTVADARTATGAAAAQRLGGGWVSGLLQALVARLWTDEAVLAGLDAAGETVAARRHALVGALQHHGLPAVGRSGLNVWLPVPDEAAVVSGLLARGWAVQHGAPYRLASQAGVRLTAAALPVEQAAQVAADVAATVGTSTGWA